MVEFPVFVSSRDSGEMRRYQDLPEMERALERIDVQNGEYVAWDRQFRLVSLQAKEGDSWLSLSVGNPAMPEFQSALRRFASSMGLEMEREAMSGTSAELMYEGVSKRVSQAKARMGWFKRLTRRF